jgi:hypothetical protein
MRFIRFAALALLAAPLVAPLAVRAQTAGTSAPTTAPATTAPQAASPGAPKVAAPKPKLTAAQRFQKRFDAANTSHDGHLTLDQAKAAKWTAVVRRFSKVDIDQKGYVTADELRADYATQHAAKVKQNTAPATTAAPARS